MGWIDVAIPGVIGLLLVAAPSLFAKSSGDEKKDAGRHNLLRGIGALLLVVAAGYLFLKMGSAR